jgi:folate-dependent phosphoribosylglycinamide formyltransferase PurN
MQIVLFGSRMHPYTLRTISELIKRKIPITALIEITKIYQEPAMVSKTLRGEGFSAREFFSRRMLNLNTIRLALENPGFAIGFLKEFLTGGKGGQDKSQRYNLKDELWDVDISDINIKSVADYNSKKCEKLLRELDTDLVLAVPAGGIIRKNILEIPKIGILNSHGPLPKYRGVDSVEWAILYSDEPYITTHFIDVSVDTGDIVHKKPIPIHKGMTLPELTARTLVTAAESMAETVEMIAIGNYKRQRQKPEDGKTYFEMHHTLKDLVAKKLESYGELLNVS